MVVRIADGEVPVEVELTRKSRRRLKELMAAWARQGSYATVVYLCGSAVLQDLVAGQALRAGADLVVKSGVCGSRGERASAELLRLLDSTLD